MRVLEYKSKNGYKGVLYGARSYAIFDRNDNKIFQVANRYVYSYEELVEKVEKFPKIYSILMNMRGDKKWKR